MVLYSIRARVMLAALMWDMQNGTTNVKSGSTVRFRVVNIGAFGFFHLWIEDHLMTVIEVDGIDVEPYVTQGIDVAVGQRYSVLVTMTGDPSRNYPIVGAMGKPPLYKTKSRPRYVRFTK